MFKDQLFKQSHSKSTLCPASFFFLVTNNIEFDLETSIVRKTTGTVTLSLDELLQQQMIFQDVKLHDPITGEDLL